MNFKNADAKTQIRCFFGLLTLCCLLAALCMPDRSDALAGLVRICTQSGQLTKSYFDPSYGGFAGTFLNVGLVCLAGTLLYLLPSAKPDDTSMLAMLLTMSFSFWGTNILNIWFSMAGVALWCVLRKKPLGSMVNAMLFSTGISPLITDMLFRYPGTEWHGFTAFGLCAALVVGVFIGVILPAGLAHSPTAHKGFDLFSAGLPIGLTALFLRALLYKTLGGALPETGGVGLGDSFPAICLGFAGAVAAASVVYGFLCGGSLTGYRQLLQHTGYKADYSAQFGCGNAFLNLGMVICMICAYYCVIGAKWNAATLGVVFAVSSCFSKGSQPRILWPIMAGYVAAAFLNKLACGALGTEFALPINAQAIVIGLCFATGLSPVAGKYGAFAGILAAMAHYALVTTIPLLHGGFCLYNGGFTAALVCILLMPAFERIFKAKEA